MISFSTVNTKRVVQSKANAHILLIENDPDSIKSLERAFAQAPIPVEIHTPRDIDTAMDYLDDARKQGYESSIFLIILGKNVSVESGRNFLDKLKKDDRYKNMPTAALTAGSESDTIGDSYRNVADAVIDKIDTLEGMTNAVDMVVRSWFQTNRDVYSK